MSQPSGSSIIPLAAGGNANQNDCQTFMNPGSLGSALPMPYDLQTPQQFQAKIRELADSIFKNCQILNGIATTNEKTIRDHWSRRNLPSRQTLVLRHWTLMAAPHRPDLDAFKTQGVGMSAGEKRQRYLYPYINQEDLKKPRNLPLFIQSRGLNKPSMFARADLKACSIGTSVHALHSDSLPGYAMMFHDRDTRQTYGELVPHAIRQSLDIAANSGARFVDEGMLILEIQESLYKFLAACATDIVGISDNVPSRTVHSIDPLSAVSLPEKIEQLPYRVPATMNMAQLRSFILAKCTAAEDHVFCLREDPRYFMETLLSYKEHSYVMIANINGSDHPALHHVALENDLWSDLFKGMLRTALYNLTMWGAIHAQVGMVDQTKPQSDNMPLNHRSLPGHALMLYKAVTLLKTFAIGTTDEINVSYKASPPMRANFSREGRSTDYRMLKVTPRPNLQANLTVHELQWMFEAMTTNSDLNSHQAVILDELELSASKDVQMRNLVSPFVNAQLSELSAMNKCLEELVRISEPFGKEFLQEKEKVWKPDLKEQYNKLEDFWEKVDLIRLNEATMSKVINLAKGSFDYPIEKARTYPNTVLLYQAEQCLDQFWQDVDQHISRHRFVSPYLNKTLTERKMQRNFPTPPSQQPKNATRLNLAANNPAPMQFAGPQIRVDVRTMQVIRLLYYLPSASTTPGTVSWNHFCIAMAKLGLTAERLYGSAWIFTASNGVMVEIHKPEGDQSLTYKTLRRYENVLNKVFGWNINSFVRG